MAKRSHSSAEFDLDLRELRGSLVAMGARSERAVELSVAAFLERDAEKASRVLTLGKRVDRDEVEVDALAVRILALRQPVAWDLRFVRTTLKFVTDLERIADEAVNIAERAQSLVGSPNPPPVFGVPKMATMVQQMLREVLDALLEEEVDRAQKVLAADDEVDALYGEILRATLGWMAEHPKQIPDAMCVASVAKYLERVADHATNLAEHVVYLENGNDVRHRGRYARGT